MAQELNLAPLQEETYDIFLCTRGLPDALTAETAALRQLMSALAGSGYKVFFPSALPRETTAEDMAGAMASAFRSARVMIAAAVGDEGAADPTARFLWKRFRQQQESEPERRFIACLREVTQIPEELRGAETLDMGELTFLSKLQGLLSAALPDRAPEPTEAPEDEPQPEMEPQPESEAENPPESAPEPPEEPESVDAPETGRKRRRGFLLLGIAAGVLVLLGLALLLFIKK